MPTKAESEKAIRSLATQWARTQPTRSDGNWHPSFIEFSNWLRSNGYGHYLEFRSVAGPFEDAERWFDEELGQAWRN